MTKLRNRIVLVLLALCLVVTAGLFVACGGDDDKKQPSSTKTVTYTVTVKADDAAVKGVKVTVKKGTASFAPKTTGDDGKAEFSLAEDSGYTVELADLPEYYEVPEGTSLTFPANRNLTVNLAEKFAYKIKLINPDGSPFTADGVTVGICTLDGTCLEGVGLDANGVARKEAAKTDYHIQIIGLPVGYAYESDSHGYSMHRSEAGTYIDQGTDNTYNSLSETVTEQTITIYPVNVIDFSKLTALTPAQIDEYNDANRTITGDKAYKVQATVPAGKTEYFTFVPEYSGTYMLYPIGYGNTNVSYRNNDLFWLGDINTGGSGMFSEYGQAWDLTADNKYYLNITNKQQSSNMDLEFIFTTPAYSKDVVTGATTVKTFIPEGGNAVIALAPTAGASYRLALQGTGAIARAYSEQDAVNYVFNDATDDDEEESDYVENAKCEVKFTEDMVGQTLYFAVSVKAQTYPAKINVVVTKLNDLTDNVEKVAPTVTLTQFGAQTGKELVDFELDGTVSSDIVYNETDKYYHYKTADGPLVVVMLTKTLPEGRAYFEDPIIYLERNSFGNIRPYIFYVTPEEDLDDLTKGNSYKDYRNMLRGFEEYKSLGPGNQYGIPADLANCYASNVNEDGVYPLTKDLKEYLERMVEEDSVLYQLGDDVQGDEWLFACYYYDTYVEPDAIAGEYNHVVIKATEDEYLTEGSGDLNGDEYSLIVNKRGTYVIKNYFGEAVEKGAWAKDEDNYTFTTTDGTVYSYVMFNQEEGYVTLMTAASTGWAFRNENSEVVDVIVGDYKFVRRYDAEDDEETEVGDSYRDMQTGSMVTVTADTYKLTVNADGTFMIYKQAGDDYEGVYDSIGEWNYKNGEYTFTVPDATQDFDWSIIDLVFAVDYNIGTGAIKLLGSDIGTSEWEFKKDGDAFVGLYELVSVTAVEENEDGDPAPRTYVLGETYRNLELAKDTFELYVVGNTVEFTSKISSGDEFVGTWAKTYGGKYVVFHSYYDGVFEYTARYNNVNNTVTLVVNNTVVSVTYVFQKKASQTMDALVGEYYATKMAYWDEETSVEEGDFRSDDYKLVVKASGRFEILAFDYPEYVALYEYGTSGTWEKTETGYAFSFTAVDFEWNIQLVQYTTTVSNGLITLESELRSWEFAKAELEAPVAPDAIVDEYKFVVKVGADGEVEKAGDSYINRRTGQEVNITADEYHLVVLKNGRYVILKLEDEEYATEKLGTWSNEGGKYAFYELNGQDAVTYGDLVYAVEFHEVLGRVVLLSENNGAWIFQKYAAETIEVDDEDENGKCTITVDDDEYTVYTFGSADMNLLSENEDARLCLFFNNCGIKFYYYSEEDGNVLAAIATAADFESETLDLTFMWKKDGIQSVVATSTMDEDEAGNDYSVITVAITYTEGEPATYVFKSAVDGGEDEFGGEDW